MLAAVVLSVATAFTAAPASLRFRPAQPAVQYQPAVVGSLPAGAFMPQLQVQSVPAQWTPTWPVSQVQVQPAQPAQKLGALGLCAVFGASALLGYGAALAVGGADERVPVLGDKVPNTSGGSSTPKGKAPSGPLGGRKADGDAWIGDQGQSEQVKKFEAGQDYLFFQGPSPKYAVQDDLPDFFSGENVQEIIENLNPIKVAVPLGIAVVIFVGFLLPVLLS